MSIDKPLCQAESGPAMRPSFVCHADILGFCELSRAEIDKGHGEAFLERLYGVLSTAHTRLQYALDAPSPTLWAEKFKMKVYTDNVILGYPIRGIESDPQRHGELEWEQIFPMFASFQTTLATEGFFLRGGIAFGDFFMDSIVVFGKPLFDAHDMDKSGGPPRIVLHGSAEKELRKHSEARGDGSLPGLRQDADGKWFIDYLHWAFARQFPNGDMPLDVIQKHKQWIEDRLLQNIGDKGVFPKYKWLADYHNSFCRDFACSPPGSALWPKGNSVCGAWRAEAQKLRNFTIEIEAVTARKA
ncbi:MAG: hypothetical protein HZA90_11685 [Verrucomicrobia bacterium]|nr:hypothetical protein [Verrucomicrobiota bacterium]